MDNDDMSKAFDDMLNQVDQKNEDSKGYSDISLDDSILESSFETKEEMGEKYPVDDFIPDLKEIEVPSFDEILEQSVVQDKPTAKPFNPPILKEIEEEPLNIGGAEIKKNDSIQPSSKQLPTMDKIKENSVGEIVIAKKSKIVKMATELWQKKKDVVKKIIAALLATLAITAYVPTIPHSIAVNSYKDNSSSLQKFEMVDKNGDPVRVKMDDLGRDIGRAIADELIIHDLMNTDKSYSINKAIIKYIGVTFDTVSKAANYTKSGAVGERNLFFKVFDFENNEEDHNWMNIVYDSLAKRLRDENIIDLPETLEEYLKANGFCNGKMSYNVYTNEFKRDPNGEVDNKGALINLSAYANYLIGREKNPEDKVSKEFNKILEKFKEFFVDFKVTYDQDGVHVTDEKGDDVYLLKGSDGGNNFVSIESPIIWSNKGR